MRLPVRLLSALALAGAAIATSIAPASSATPQIYAALGDSYASGQGAGSGFNYLYEASCFRSSRSSAALWAAAHPAYTFTHIACAGAHTYADQGFGGSNSTLDVHDQIPRLDPGTTLVTVSVGGNDLGFVDMAATCLTQSTSQCQDAYTARITYADNGDPANGQRKPLDNAIAIYKEIHAKAPRAKILVTGYPLIYTLNGTCDLGKDANRQIINNGINEMDNRLQTAIAGLRATMDITFVDVRSRFAGHGVCASVPYLNGTTNNPLGALHPNADGYRLGYLPAVTAVTG